VAIAGVIRTSHRELRGVMKLDFVVFYAVSRNQRRRSDLVAGEL
jgi:hypothetical protein